MEGERKRYGGSGAVRVGKTKKACVFREREREKRGERVHAKQQMHKMHARHLKTRRLTKSSLSLSLSYYLKKSSQ